MSVKLFVGGLSWGTDDRTLRSKFEEYGTVEDAVVIRDRDTGRSRGFGFVTFASNEEAEIAIQNLNDAEFDGRNIKGIHKFLLINPHNNLFTSIYNFIILVFENS
ncbi:10443_t:CDS:2 [Rhizophagus irregularis]|nr:10443_t:CDS:2 [Rhizophagus irregularis]